jgi:hypothetical protein
MGGHFAGIQTRQELLTRLNHAAWRPWRLQALAFKAIRARQPEQAQRRGFPREAEHPRLDFVLINGNPLLRAWVGDPEAAFLALDKMAQGDETPWLAERSPFHFPFH